MGGQGSEGMRQFPLQQSFECQQSSPSGKHLPSIEEWTAQGKRKSSQAEAWKRVSPAFVSTDATCSRFRSTPPTPSSSSRAASVICTATSIMQAMASRWSAAAETLEVDIVMVAKPFSLNTHSNQNACRRNTGSMERRAEVSAKEIVRDCEETVRICAFFIDTWEHTPARDSYCKGLRCTATWFSANEIGRDLYPEGKGKSSSDIFWSVDEKTLRFLGKTFNWRRVLKQPVPNVLLRLFLLVCPLPCHFRLSMPRHVLGRCYAHFRLVTVLRGLGTLRLWV